MYLLLQIGPLNFCVRARCPFFGEGTSDMFWCTTVQSTTLGGPHCVIVILKYYPLWSYPLGVTIRVMLPYHYPLTLLEDPSLWAWPAKHRSSQGITVVGCMIGSSSSLSDLQHLSEHVWGDGVIFLSYLGVGRQ